MRRCLDLTVIADWTFKNASLDAVRVVEGREWLKSLRCGAHAECLSTLWPPYGNSFHICMVCSWRYCALCRDEYRDGYRTALYSVAACSGAVDRRIGVAGSGWSFNPTHSPRRGGGSFCVDARSYACQRVHAAETRAFPHSLLDTAASYALTSGTPSAHRLVGHCQPANREPNPYREIGAVRKNCPTSAHHFIGKAK